LRVRLAMEHSMAVDDVEESVQRSLLRYVGNTPLERIRLGDRVRRGVEIFAKLEFFNPGGSIKDRPMLRMVVEAIKSGELTEDKVLLDSTSGNAGIAYAMIARVLGYRAELVLPGTTCPEIRKTIEAFGANTVITDPAAGYIGAIEKAHELYEANRERYFRADQYANRWNPVAHYETTGREILEQTDGKVTHFVAGVGTGGTLMGVGRRLKEHSPAVKVYAVHPDRDLPGIEGLGPWCERPHMPEIYDEGLVDGHLYVSASDAKGMCRALRGEGYFVGRSSGANLLAALRLSEQIAEGVIVTVFADTASRYYSNELFQ